MKCLNCNTKINDIFRFCDHCGTKITSICHHCGYKNRTQARFCGLCGAALEINEQENIEQNTEPEMVVKSEQKIEKEQISVNLSQVIKKTSADVLAMDAELYSEEQAQGEYIGERKFLTILFADVKGSTALAADRDPEETRSIIEPVLKIMKEAVHKYGGTVIKSAGDGIMALFGAPIAYEDHALRACYAGLYMQKQLQLSTSDIQIRVGINSGEAVVDVIASDVRAEYDVMGHSVNVAARMEQLAEPGTVQISPDTYELVKRLVTVESRGKTAVKGLDEPINIYLLVTVKEAITAFENAEHLYSSEFVNREKEMLLLNNLLERSLLGHGNAVGLVGEAGQGKTRLASEFLTNSQHENYRHYEIQSYRLLKNTPFYPIKSFIKVVFSIKDEAPEKEKKIIDKYLNSLGEEVLQYKNVFYELLNIFVDDKEWLDLSPEFRRQIYQKGVMKLLMRISSNKGLVLIIDDMQWLDNETMEIFNKLLANIEEHKILLLVTYRLDYTPSWESNSNYTKIYIEPLNNDSALKLIDSYMGSFENLSEFKTLLLERSEGNPFFIEEMIHSLAETNVLIGEEGDYQLAKPLHEIQLPKTVHAVMLSRVDQLSVSQKRVIQIASVVGRKFPLRLLRALVYVDDDTFKSIISVLIERGFLYESVLYPEIELSFRHSVTQEAIYNSLLKKKKMELHLLALSTVEKKFPEWVKSLYEILARHAFVAEAWDKAFQYYHLAGIEFYNNIALEEAVASFGNAIASYKNISHPTAEQGDDYYDSLFKSLQTLIWLGSLDRVLSLVNETKQYVKSREKDFFKTELITFAEGVGFILTGQYLAAEKLMKTFYKTGPLTKTELLNKSFIMVHLHTYFGQFRDTGKCLKTTEENVSNYLERDPLTASPYWVAGVTYAQLAFGELGDFDAIAIYRKKIQNILENLKPGIEMVSLAVAMAEGYFFQTDFKHALEMLDMAMDTRNKCDLKLYDPMIFTMYGYIFSLLRDSTRGERYLKEAYQASAIMRFSFKGEENLPALCEAYLFMHDYEKVDELLQIMEDSLKTKGRKSLEPYIYRLKADAFLQRGNQNYKHIEALYKKSIAAANKLAMLPQVAHANRKLGVLYEHLNQLEKASQFQALANQYYHEKKMFFWLAKNK